MAPAGRKSKIGAAYVALVPSFDGFFIATDREMTRKLPMIMEKVFKDIGKDAGREFGTDFSSAFDSVVTSNMRAAINSAANVSINIPAPTIGMPIIPTPALPNINIPAPTIPAPTITQPNQGQLTQAGTQAGTTMGGGMAAGIQAAMAGVAAMVAGAGGLEVFKGGMAKQAGADKLQAQLNLSADETAKLAGVTENLFKDAYGESSEVIAANMKNIVGSIKGARQMSSEELYGMGTDVANLSSTFGLESELVAQSVQSMLSNGTAGSWDEAISVITAGYQDMGSNASDLIDSYREYSGDLAQFGINAKQSYGMVKAMMAGGFYNTDTAFDLIRETGIQARSGENAEVLAALGLDPAQVQKAANEGGDAWLKTFKEITGALEKTGNDSLWGEIMGTQAEDQLNAAKSTNWSQALADVDDLSGRMGELDKNLNDNAATNWTEMMNTLNTLFTNHIMPAVTWITPHLKTMSEWLDKNAWVAGVLAVVIGGALVIGAAAATVAFWAMMAPFLPMVGMIAAVVAGIALIAGLVWLIAANWDGIVTFMVNIWNGFAQWWVGMWGGFGSMMTDFGNNTLGMFEDMGKHIGNFFIGILNYVLRFINTVITAINDLSRIKMPAWMGGQNFGGFNIGTVAEVPMMAEGGTVKPKSGGIPTIIGVSEKGKAESIVDAGLLNDQLAAATASLNENQGGASHVGDVIYEIHQQPGESTEELLARLEELQDLKGYYK